MRQILITLEQDTLLYALVKAARSLDSADHQAFQLLELQGDSGDPRIAHPGLPGGELHVRAKDVEALVSKGLLRQSGSRPGGPRFDLDPRAYAYYHETPRAAGKPTPRSGISARAHMESGSFERSYPAAYLKWTQAEALLLEDDPQPEAAAIHELCCQALHAFAGYLGREFDCPLSDPDETPAAARVGTVLETPRLDLGADARLFLNALLAHWETRFKRFQGQPSGIRLVDGSRPWQDLHLAVFHTAVVMFEIDRALSQLR